VSWVEDLKPEDDVKVEILYPTEYAEYSKRTMRRFARGMACMCKGAALLGEDECGFGVCGMTMLQVIAIREVFAQFGIIFEYE
jgi:hypothetical protein